MTSNKPDLSDLIKRNQQLEKENARLRQELARLTLLAHDKADELMFAATNPETFGIGTFEEIASALANIEEDGLIISQAPATPFEAPADNNRHEDYISYLQVTMDKPAPEAPKLFSVHRIDTDGYRPDAVHFDLEAMPSMLAVLRHIESKQWWIIRNSDSVMIAQSKDS